MKEKTERKEGHQQPWGTVRTAQKKQSSNSETTERSELGQICGSMKLGEKKTVLLAFRENIEMKLFSSDEPCVVMPTTEEEEEEHSFNQVSLQCLTHTMIGEYLSAIFILTFTEA